MKNRLKRLSANGGFSYVMTAVLIVAIMMITAAVLEVVRLNAISSNYRDKFEAALVEISVENYRGMYSSARDGFTASYSYNNGTWQNINNVSATRINNRIFNALNGGEENQINSVRNISFTVIQTKGTTNSRFSVTGSCDVEIPFKMLWNNTIKLHIGADTQWTAQF